MESFLLTISAIATLICFFTIICVLFLNCLYRCTTWAFMWLAPFGSSLFRAQPQDQNVFNISSRVQGQEQRHPDAFVSLEHITIMNELNKPPKYDDAPPSYEEAIKIAMAQDNSLKTFQTEVAASQGTSSSSSAAATSSAATPQIQPAIPNRTE
ncbi:uncharacterized protein LOC143201430 isoform X5 [Rhynchophorus ferrugineus]|uniref:uncharacterized protein LOC143201430 isoform X5 n=1 Tax=Rhynchophorus ferrugineus TaxID=354439 RepID=UPI003FCC62FD